MFFSHTPLGLGRGHVTLGKSVLLVTSAIKFFPICTTTPKESARSGTTSQAPRHLELFDKSPRERSQS